MDAENIQLLEESKKKAFYSAGFISPAPMSGLNGAFRSKPSGRAASDPGLEGLHLETLSAGGGDGDEFGGRHYCHARGARNTDRSEGERRHARRKLCIAAVICLLFMAGEIFGGFLAHSLAIMTDAAHLFADFASFSISLFSLWVSSRPPTKTMNFGWYRAEILGALLSVLTIWVVTGVLVYLASLRLIYKDFEIEGTAMLVTSGCAIAVNVIMSFTLYQANHLHSHGGVTADATEPKPLTMAEGPVSGPQANPSVRAAFIHVVGDLLQSIGVLIAACVIYAEPEYKIADPICTFVFSFFVLFTTVTILRDVLLVLMEGAPRAVKFTDVQEALLALPHVCSVHDVHLWSLTINHCAICAHVCVDDIGKGEEVVREATVVLQTRFSFSVLTIQVEKFTEDMHSCRDCQEPSG
uniref:Zinc transporter 2-like isoform X1 n=2 Tax=Petromyzon marinus TaxID=7757 RepID=A0AAJ7T3N3_PETMA|nr:zinc transporter 2-like isoform X1 [Petromyzon marinus]XP_032810565.1 zinc transporter 2-like isoform X1 [Petromyzon marinus]